MTDEVGTIPAFPEVAVLHVTVKYTCVKCGGDNVSVDLSRPSIDPRYALGDCRDCSPKPKGKKNGEAIHKRQSAILREEER